MKEFIISMIVIQLAIVSWRLRETNTQLKRIADQVERACRK